MTSGDIQKAPEFTPKKVFFTSIFSTLCSPRRTPAPGALPSHTAFEEGTKDFDERGCDCHDQPSDAEQAGLEKSSAEAGEAVSAREGFITATFVWVPNVKHQHPLDLALQEKRVPPRVPTPASSLLSPAACPACDSAQRLVILGN
jgi:hypothetical protein